MLGKNPIMAPLSIALNIRGFTINQDVSSLSDKEHENEQNELNITSINVLNNRQIRKKNGKDLPGWKN